MVYRAPLLVCGLFLKKTYLDSLLKLLDRYILAHALLVGAVIAASYIRLSQIPQMFELVSPLLLLCFSYMVVLYLLKAF